ncbi:MAG: hypothetical protein OEY05_06970 [Paracoccaceae bacterium]|nr:hypothetical protein [Paracoccaceae bacterium]
MIRKGNRLIRLFCIALFVSASATASAAEWAMRTGDQPFEAAELAAFLASQEVRFYDGGRSEYGPDDAYAYVYSSEDRAEGKFRIMDDGSVCIAFDNGFSRCDLYVRSGDRVLLIDEKGDRFPLR